MATAANLQEQYDLAWALKSKAAGLTIGSRPPRSEPDSYNPPRVKRPPIRAHQPERRFRKRYPRLCSAPMHELSLPPRVEVDAYVSACLAAAERFAILCRVRRPRSQPSAPSAERPTAFTARAEAGSLPVRKIDLDAVETAAASPTLCEISVDRVPSKERVKRLTSSYRDHHPRVEMSPPPVVRQTAFAARTGVGPMPVKALDFDAVEMAVAPSALSPPEEPCSHEPADDHVPSKELISAQCLPPPDDWENAYDDEGNRLEAPPPVEQCASQGDSRVPATPAPHSPVASAVDSWEQHAELLTVEPPRHARLHKHRRLRHALATKRMGVPDGSCEHKRLRCAMFSVVEALPPPQPRRPYHGKFLSPRVYTESAPIVDDGLNPDVYTESANKLYQLQSRQLGRVIKLPPSGATTKQKRNALRATAATDAHRADHERVDERDDPDYGLRGLDDVDIYFDEEVYDAVDGDTIVASRRERGARPPRLKLDFGTLAVPGPTSPSSILELDTLEATDEAAAVETAAEPPTVEWMDELAATPRHEQLAATRIQACYRGTLTRGNMSSKATQAADRESIAATRIQSCWRGVLGQRDPEATAMQLAFDAKPQAATPPTPLLDPPAEQPTVESMDELAATPSQYAMVVEESRELAAELAVAADSEEEVVDIGAALKVDIDTTPGDRQRLAMAESADDEALRTGVERSLAPKPTLALAANTPLWGGIGRRMANTEPRTGGMCMIVSLLESPIAKEDYLHRLLDHLEHKAEAAKTVVSYHEFAEKEIKTYELESLGHALRRVYGISDVAACVAQLREPIGYRPGLRLAPALPGAVLCAAASYMKVDIVVLDASTATPLYAIVRCPSSHPVLLGRLTHVPLRI